MDDLLELLVNLMSPDNGLRTRSELQFKHMIESDPDSSLYNLAQVGLNHSVDATVRLASILHLKRYTPKYWSAAFDKYVGPKTTNQHVKQTVRDALFTLLADDSSKIRSAAAYAMVQIAVVDYPDEWPDLLNKLYDSIINKRDNTSAVLGSLSALHQLFDDLITDEQFFQGGLAVEMMKTCEIMLTSDAYTIDVKVATLPLVKSIIDMLEDSAYYEDSQRRNFINTVIPKMLELLSGLSLQITASPTSFLGNIMLWDFKSKLYECLNALVNSFSKFLKSKGSSLIDVVTADLSKEQPLYNSLCCNNQVSTESLVESAFSDLELFRHTEKEGATPVDIVVATIRSQVEFLQSLLELQPLERSEKLSVLIDLFTKLNFLTSDKAADYQSDFNEFVTDETDLSIAATVRSSLIGFFTELNGQDNALAIDILVRQLTSHPNEPQVLESLTVLLTCSFDNDTEIATQPSFSLKDLFDFITSCIDDIFHRPDNFSEILLANFVILLPKFLMKYSQNNANLRSLAVPSLKRTISYLDNIDGNSDDYQLLKSALVISFQYYNQFIRTKEFDNEIQFKMMGIINQLKDDSEEDTNIMTLEAFTVLISIDNKALSSSDDAFLLILAIGYKDCSNFSLNTPTLECISDLIKNLPLENYMTLSSKVLVLLIPIISHCSGEYSAEVDLTLQILAEYVKGPNDDFKLPHDFFEYVFSPICKFILRSEDDHLLQSASTAFNEIVRRSSCEIDRYGDAESGDTGNEMLLRIVAKFLKPGVSDQAIVNLGSLIVLIIDNFSGSDLIKRYFSDMLRGVTVRLLSSKEVPTIENMILIFNKLMTASPSQTLQFLKSFNLGGHDFSSALAEILPTWFQAFEVMRGYDKILDNIRAFSELLKLNDPILATIQVKGDLLPNQIPDDVILTRSMTKNIELKYQSIPADAKVIRLLVKELRFQLQSIRQEDNDVIAGAQTLVRKEVASAKEDTTEEEEEEEEESDWEDLDDVKAPSFSELQQYVEGENIDEGYLKRSGRANSDIKNYLVDFFKDCFVGKVTRFQEIYTHYLHGNDKKLLTESLVSS
ncbi:hypothetical protein FOA43_003144 [Brettanomyces nanus]|uniref:Importin N-terminal domain-containing protein n=1 Tax=Eeniella nana TaxID=13502 RepID=A0A875S4E8_EENNA|nr:uncharacterized protein FOA43_003144 [Brettanomyces nanus]QPG75783.1 hypothetical protein FOA43_003144 [Brettanomyces nanus]